MSSAPLRSIDPAIWKELGRLVQSHIERRFGAAAVECLQPWGASALRSAARSLATAAVADHPTIGIVTGFCVTSADPPAAETDGPPGALMLASVLHTLGVRVVLVSDRYGVPLLRAGAAHCGLGDVAVAECPLSGSDAHNDADTWCRAFLDEGAGRTLTHLVSIERAGPSHAVESLRRQGADVSLVQRFAEAVPESSRGHCHNMRGDVIDRFTAPLDCLFDLVGSERRDTVTIGIGDGGNEIGLGTLPWQLLSDLGESAATSAAGGGSRAGVNMLARVACRVSTDHTIVAGVSNWGGFALALAVAALRGLSPSKVANIVDSQTDLVETLVDSAGAVDGFSGQRQPTVDGLGREAHQAPLVNMHELLFPRS